MSGGFIVSGRATEPVEGLSIRTFAEDGVLVRIKGGDVELVPGADVDYMDVSPRQMVSVATAMIPFLEHDDANRALMGSNMMRQAVPLLRPQAPIVGTGLEERVARDSRVLLTAEGEGVVKFVDSDRIVIEYKRTEDERAVSFDGDEKEYKITKFLKTNQSTCMNLRPIVKKGEKVTVDVAVFIEGEAAPETFVSVELPELTVEAEATNIPENITISVEGLTAGTQILASDVELPEGVSLGIDTESLVVNITQAISEAALEAELAEAEEAAGIEQDEPEAEDEAAAAEEPAEGESDQE